MTNCVAEMILNHNEIKKRVAVIRHFIAVADVSDPNMFVRTILI